MNINRKEEHERPRPRDSVTVKECGNLIEVRYSVNAPPETVIQKLTAELYLDKRTGEVKAFRHPENRAEDKSSVAQSLCRLRDLINTNVTDPDRVLWVTLTYRENKMCIRDRDRNYTTVKRILKNPVYLGHTLLGKSKKVSVKSKKKVPVPRDDWAVTENTHPPLVSEQLYERSCV